MPSLAELKEKDPEKYQELMAKYNKISQGVATGMAREAHGPNNDDGTEQASNPNLSDDPRYKKIKSLFGY